MKWIRNFFTNNNNASNAPVATNNKSNKSSVVQRTNLLIKVKKGEGITDKEIQSFTDIGGSLNEIINKQTNETLLDRAIKLKNQPAIDALKKHGARTNREKMNKVITEIPAARDSFQTKNQQQARERSDSGHTTVEERSSRSSSISEDQSRPEKWKKANPDATEIADQARENKINELEKEKNKPIVIPKMTKRNIAEEMERQLQARQAAARSANTGKKDFRSMERTH